MNSTQIYDEIGPISRDEAIEHLQPHRSEPDAVRALIGITLYDSDPDYIMQLLTQHLSDHRPQVVSASIVGFGHLIRLHPSADQRKMQLVLSPFVNHPIFGGRVSDVLDDISMFSKDRLD